MRINLGYIACLLVINLLVACTQSSSGTVGSGKESSVTTAPQPSALLPNLIIAVNGPVAIWHYGSQDEKFYPVGFGASVAPDDLLRGSAKIFCGDESLWNANPQPLLGDRQAIPCSVGRPYRHNISLSAMRGKADTPFGAPAISDLPYVLSPRTGFVLNDRPTLRWHPVTSGTTYTLTLESSDGQQRPTITGVTGHELPYPDQWPPLQGRGATYTLRVQTDHLDSTQEAADLSFALLSTKPYESQQLQSHLVQLEAKAFDEPAFRLLKAQLYRNPDYKLYSEAVELLLYPSLHDQPAIQQLLGELYLEMGLLSEAESAFQTALDQAQTSSWQELTADVQARLALIACLHNDPTSANALRHQASLIRSQLGPARAEDVVFDRLIYDLDPACIESKSSS